VAGSKEGLCGSRSATRQVDKARIGFKDKLHNVRAILMVIARKEKDSGPDPTPVSKALFGLPRARERVLAANPKAFGLVAVSSIAL